MKLAARAAGGAAAAGAEAAGSFLQGCKRSLLVPEKSFHIHAIIALEACAKSQLKISALASSCDFSKLVFLQFL